LSSKLGQILASATPIIVHIARVNLILSDFHLAKAVKLDNEAVQVRLNNYMHGHTSQALSCPCK
jgi:hypothetical protein